MIENKLDCKSLLCPLPVIRTQSKIKELQPGETLTVICTDPGTLYDIPAWCRMYGHEVIATDQKDDEILFKIAVKEN